MGGDMAMILPLLPFITLAVFYHDFQVIYAHNQEKRKPKMLEIEKEPIEALLSLQVYCKAMMISEESLQEISARLASLHNSMPEDVQIVTFGNLTYDKETRIITCNKVSKNSNI